MPELTEDSIREIVRDEIRKGELGYVEWLRQLRKQYPAIMSAAHERKETIRLSRLSSAETTYP